jgi:anti-sigma B factor antagonist
MDTTVRTATYGAVSVVHVTGDLDVRGAGMLRRELTDLIASGPLTWVVVDLTRTPLIDSTGLCVLVGAGENLHHGGGRLCLVIHRDALLRTLRISSLVRMFTIHNDLENALSFFAPKVGTRGTGGERRGVPSTDRLQAVPSPRLSLA